MDAACFGLFLGRNRFGVIPGCWCCRTRNLSRNQPAHTGGLRTEKPGQK